MSAQPLPVRKYLVKRIMQGYAQPITLYIGPRSAALNQVGVVNSFCE